MKMKLSRRRFAEITREENRQIVIESGLWLPHSLMAGRHTKTDYVATNVSTADVESLVHLYGDEGIRIAGRDNRFRTYDDPQWRE